MTPTVNTPPQTTLEKGRQKWCNLCVDDRVSLSATDLANNGLYLKISDWVVAWKSDADMAFLDGHCLQY